MIVLVLNFLHHSYAVLESDLVCDPHFCGGSIAHAVQYLVKYIDLLLVQRIFKRYAELVKLIGELGGVDLTLYEKEDGKKNYTQRIVIYYRFVGYLELPSSEDENYKANTRKGVDVEYIPTAKSA